MKAEVIVLPNTASKTLTETGQQPQRMFEIWQPTWGLEINYSFVFHDTGIANKITQSIFFTDKMKYQLLQFNEILHKAYIIKRCVHANLNKFFSAYS